MSLTQVLEMGNVKEVFASSFKRPEFPRVVPALLAPSQAKSSSLVDIAFDYLFRFEIIEQFKTRPREKVVQALAGC